jgi:hypothetical protein
MHPGRKAILLYDGVPLLYRGRRRVARSAAPINAEPPAHANDHD